jgi:7-cyano-7-deazaguanine synthase in queuosine biosynthesis
MKTNFVLKPTGFNYDINNHFPTLKDSSKKLGVFLSGGMESCLISLICLQRYPTDSIIFFYSDNIFSGNNEKFNNHIRTNIDRAEKLLGIKATYVDFDYESHVNKRKETTEKNIQRLKDEYNVEFVLWGFTKLFFEVEEFKQDNMTIEQINDIAFNNPKKFKSTIEEFHLDTGEYTECLLDIDIPADVYPVLRDSAGFIKSPFKDLNKCEVVDLYRQLGWLEKVYQTSSCILESLTETGKHCGYCFNCQQRYDAFRILGDIEDKTEYVSDEIVKRRNRLEQIRNAIHS